MTETFESENSNNSNVSNNSESHSTGNSNMKNLFQDTPQGELDTTSIKSQKWATNLSLNENNTNGNITDNSTSVGKSNGTNNYIKKIIGNNGGKYNIELLKEVQNSILNIDIMIINELQDLFMGIF